MLIQLLDYLQSGETYSIQDLAELLNKDVDTILTELEYLEQQGYIRKSNLQGSCSRSCKNCHGCDEQNSKNFPIWEMVASDKRD